MSFSIQATSPRLAPRLACKITLEAGRRSVIAIKRYETRRKQPVERSEPEQTQRGTGHGQIERTRRKAAGCRPITRNFLSSTALWLPIVSAQGIFSCLPQNHFPKGVARILAARPYPRIRCLDRTREAVADKWETHSTADNSTIRRQGEERSRVLLYRRYRGAGFVKGLPLM
ncbi:hypothetical protein GGR56DRAFT_652236 [Xylariaceae sp. FL0804]|nr:hypothetical protein GGR56DRAFT_652236 [Xylariaceae sp. FL0804]